jgi:O-acetyl-ADP-ribose deacetylase
MPELKVLHSDITQVKVDAIVNAANERMLGGGGVDGAIHAAAGPRLLAACRAVPEVRPGVRCPTGDARITEGFNLPARYVIHTVGPIWQGGRNREDELLVSCYRASLRLADAYSLRSIAFPAISCGVYGFPAERASSLAVREIRQYLANATSVDSVTLVSRDEAMVEVLREAVYRYR